MCLRFLIYTIFFIVTLSSSNLFAQQAILAIEEDDALPIAPTRYDDAVEIPKNNFSSSDGKDKWEKYENGELDAKAYVELQEEYNAILSGKPEIQRKVASQRSKMLKREAQLTKGNLLKKDKKKELKTENKIIDKANTKRVPSSLNQKNSMKKDVKKKDIKKKSK
jgi:hypothetical protein